MKPEDIEALLTIVKYFGLFSFAMAVAYAVYIPIFNYLVKRHKKFMKRVIPSYFEKERPY